MAIVKLRTTQHIEMSLTEQELRAFRDACRATGETMGQVLATTTRGFTRRVQAELATNKEIDEALKNLPDDAN